MNYIFQSCYQNAMNGYLGFRKALGFSVEASLTYLRRFDRYCAGNEITSDSLTKEVVDAWFKDEQEKGYIDMSGRARIMRTFAKYLRGTGVSAYILPSYLCRGTQKVSLSNAISLLKSCILPRFAAICRAEKVVNNL